MDKNAEKSTRVNIFGEELGIRSEASPEYTRKVAEYVDKAMKQVAKATNITDIHRIAILAAMSITDEFFQARDRVDRAGEIWESRVSEIVQALRDSAEDAGEGNG